MTKASPAACMAIHCRASRASRDTAWHGLNRCCRIKPIEWKLKKLYNVADLMKSHKWFYK
jgi:hypothetical protein